MGPVRSVGVSSLRGRRLALGAATRSDGADSCWALHLALWALARSVGISLLRGRRIAAWEAAHSVGVDSLLRGRLALMAQIVRGAAARSVGAGSLRGQQLSPWAPTRSVGGSSLRKRQLALTGAGGGGEGLRTCRATGSLAQVRDALPWRAWTQGLLRYALPSSLPACCSSTTCALQRLLGANAATSARPSSRQEREAASPEMPL